MGLIMSKYTVKSFSGKFIFVAMNSPSDFFQSTTKINLTIKFHNGRIDEDSKASLLKQIDNIQRDVKAESKFIASHWYDDKGKVEYVEKEFDSDAGPDDQGRVIEARTFPLTSVMQIEDFVAYLGASANEFKHTKVPNIYTPLLNSQQYAKPQHEEEGKPDAENGIVACLCNLLKC